MGHDANETPTMHTPPTQRSLRQKVGPMPDCSYVYRSSHDSSNLDERSVDESSTASSLDCVQLSLHRTAHFPLWRATGTPRGDISGKTTPRCIERKAATVGTPSPMTDCGTPRAPPRSVPRIRRISAKAEIPPTKSPRRPPTKSQHQGDSLWFGTPLESLPMVSDG